MKRIIFNLIIFTLEFIVLTSSGASNNSAKKVLQSGETTSKPIVAGETQTYTASITPGNALDKSVIWASPDPF